MVQGPDGTVWSVDRNVWPWRTPAELLGRRTPRRDGMEQAEAVGDAAWLATDLFTIADHGLAPLAIGTALVAVVAFGMALVVGLAGIVLALFALALAGAVATWRAVARRPWTVTAASSTGELVRWQVQGWQASRAKVAEVERAVRLGNPLPPSDRVDDDAG